MAAGTLKAEKQRGILYPLPLKICTVRRESAAQVSWQRAAGMTDCFIAFLLCGYFYYLALAHSKRQLQGLGEAVGRSVADWWSERGSKKISRGENLFLKCIDSREVEAVRFTAVGQRGGQKFTGL